MNRILPLITASLLALFLTACGEEKNTVKPEEVKPVGTEVQVPEQKADETKAMDQQVQTTDELKSE